LVVVSLLTVGFGVLPAHAAVGDLVATVNLPVPGQDVGIAFDGTRLYYSPGDTSLVSFEPSDPVGTMTQVTVTRASDGATLDLDAMAWDSTRDLLWAVVHNTDDVYQVDVATGIATFAFSAAGKCTRCIGSFRDGLAFDAGNSANPNDDALWWSRDVDFEVFKLDLNGNTIESFDVQPIDSSLSSCGNSGIAVGGPNLYLGTDGCDTIVRANKTTKTFVDILANPQSRPEDLECDPSSFAPTQVMWVRQFEDSNTVKAFEIEPGTCGLGGERPLCDPNGDGDTNFRDVFALLRFLRDPNPPAEADCNGDGEVNVRDLLSLFRDLR
jgi:hypothetical protein